MDLPAQARAVITYAERSCFRPSHLRALSRVQQLVDRISDAWGNELCCHELARAVLRVLDDSAINVVDGHCGPIEHSWLVHADGVILDPYAPGRLPAAQIIDPLVGLMYRGGAPRTDVRTLIVDALEREMRLDGA